jgi:predicted transposase YbfD/YdcC
VPGLLEMLSLKGCIATVDALNGQRDIAQQIIDHGGDYALALKGNPGTLHADVRKFLDDPKLETAITTTDKTVDGEHGRIETRLALISTEIAWLQEDHQGPGLAAIAKIVRSREFPTKTSTETAYCLLSAPLSAERLNGGVRSHWASRTDHIGASTSA